MYDFGTSDGYSFIWHEAISGRGACEIASCVYSYINIMSQKGKKNFIFYSDNCCAQNKNRYYVTMLWYCLQKFHPSSITHKYLEKGHTQNENDSVHSAVESASRNVSIYTTPQWAATVRKARPKQPHIVKEMSVEDCCDFKSMSTELKNVDTITDNEKVYWNTFKKLIFSQSNPNVFQYQTDYQGNILSVDLLRHLRSDKPSPNDLILSPLRTSEVPINKRKYKDLIYLCTRGIIPRAHHRFYLLLPYNMDDS